MGGDPVSCEKDVYNRLVSRWDVWAQQATKPDEKGRYGYFTKKTKLSENEIYDSILSEKKTIGAYIVNPVNNTCTNPQIDVDNHDGKQDVKANAGKVFNELKRIGLNPYIEASSGELSMGAHIGLICKPTSAKICKSVLDDVLKTLNLSGHEVFPKQTEVNPDSFGNLVKLPFQFNNRTKQRSQIINPETMEPFERQNAVEYLMALPDSVFEVKEDIDTPIQPVKEAQKAASEPIKSNMSFDELFGDIDIKPCIKKAYIEKWQLHEIGTEGHDFRLAVAGNLLDYGIDGEIIYEYFKLQSDYNRAATKKGIDSARQHKLNGGRPMGCTKIIEKCSKLLNGMCDTCPKKPNKKKSKAPSIDSEPLSESNPIFTDMRNSKRLAAKVGVNARYCGNWKTWVVFNGKQWVREEGGVMLRYARQVVLDLEREALLVTDFEKKKEIMNNALRCESTPRLKSMVELCQSEPGMTIDENIFDADPMKLNLQNGTLNLTTGKIETHNPLDYQMKISPVTFDPNAKCDRWLQFLDEALSYNNEGESEDEKAIHDEKKRNVIGYLKRHSGYSMTGIVNEEQFLIIFGDGGHGKSKFANTIGYVMGGYHDKIDIITLQETSKSKNGSSPTPDIVKLKGLRYITTSEPEKGLKLNESRIKDFTGRDEITGRGLHEKPITYLPIFKLTIYTNYRIIIRGQDKSIWRRVHQVGFDQEPKNIDKDLDKKLQKEASGILNWMLEGCMDWQKDGLNVPQEIIDDVVEYKDEMDILSDFFSLCCEYEKGNRSITSYGNDLFHVYQAWWGVENRNNAPYFRQQFLDAVIERGFKKIKKDKRGVVLGGVKLKKAVSDMYEQSKTLYAGYKNDAMTAMTAFLTNFVTESHVTKKPDIAIIAVIASSKQPEHNESKNNHCAPKEIMKSAHKKPEDTVCKVLQSTELKPEDTVCKVLQSTELTKIILDAGEHFTRSNGVINSSNIDKFSFWLCEQHHPKWQSNGESGEYTPSAIRGIVAKIFKLTPEPGQGAAV